MDILVFGNSITQGAFDAECGGWVSRLTAHVHQKDLDRELDDRSVVFNLGVSGENIEGIKKRFLSEYTARTNKDDQALVIFAVGVNDSKIDLAKDNNVTPHEIYAQTLAELIGSVRERDTVVCVGLAPIDDTNLDPMSWNPNFAYRCDEVKKYDATIQKVSEQTDRMFIPMQDVLDPAQHLVDGIHPNAEGHRRMFERVKSALEQQGYL